MIEEYEYEFNTINMNSTPPQPHMLETQYEYEFSINVINSTISRGQPREITDSSSMNLMTLPILVCALMSVCVFLFLIFAKGGDNFKMCIQAKGIRLETRLSRGADCIVADMEAGTNLVTE